MIEAWLWERLKTNADVVALAGTRTFPIYAPQNAPYPFITFRRSNTRRDYEFRKQDGKPFVTFDVHVWDADYRQLKQLASRVRIAVDGYTQDDVDFTIDHVFVTDEYDIPEPPDFAGESPVYGVRLVVEIAHAETVPTYT